MIRYLFSIFIVIFLFVMCSKDNRDVISMKEFKSGILDSDTTVLDVRTEEEFYGPLGHIEGAILIPIDDLEGRVGELNSVKNEKIYVVCRTGGRSGRGKDFLNSNGFTAVNVDGGMVAWESLENE
tara:strand:- start:2694 stop:3068 length:375 start_codon:yes stop_codon:yes gene_type:complete